MRRSPRWAYSGRMRSKQPRLGDIAIAMAFAAFAGLSVVIINQGISYDVRHFDALGIALVVGQAVPLAWRTRYPRTALWCTAAIWAVAAGLGYSTSSVFFPMILTLYTVGAYLPRRQAFVQGGTVGGLVVAWTVVGSLATSYVPWPSIVSAALMVALPVGIGRADRRRRERLTELELAEQRRHQAQQIAAADAVRAERARIARELHDVVAHEMTVMTLQAEGAKRRAAKSDPALAETLGTIADAGRVGLAEMQRMIGVLRTSEREAEDEAAAITGRHRAAAPVGAAGADDFTPMPSLAAIPSLVRQVEESGLPVRLAITGTSHVPAGVELNAYRIIQESLTNALKYAGQGATATVTVRRHKDCVTVTVEDDGRGTITEAAASSGGHGLVGMRERVAALGGTIETGTRKGGGFRVHAMLPVSDDRTTSKARPPATEIRLHLEVKQ